MSWWEGLLFCLAVLLALEWFTCFVSGEDF